MPRKFEPDACPHSRMPKIKRVVMWQYPCPDCGRIFYVDAGVWQRSRIPDLPDPDIAFPPGSENSNSWPPAYSSYVFDHLLANVTHLEPKMAEEYEDRNRRRSAARGQRHAR